MTLFDLKPDKIIDNRWKVEKFIREGSFHSAYYEVNDIERPIRTCTLKIESNAPTGPTDPPRFLILEKNLLKAVKEKNAKYNLGLEGYGQFDGFNYVIFNSVGLNLDEIKSTMPDKRFTLRTCLHIARRSLYCVEELHSAGFVHRDIKPRNLFVGKTPDDLRQMYLGNYELCKKYVDDHGAMRRPRRTVAFRGTPKYASVNALEEHEQGRPDDLWAWFFSIIELSLGKLAWKDKNGPADMVHYICWLAAEKRNLLNDKDRFLQGCPREYGVIYNNLKNLNYETKPDYNLLLLSINEAMRRKGYTSNIPLDWEPRSVRVQRSSSSSRSRTANDS